MTQFVAKKLHSNAPVVVIEAPGGCGKTTTAAKFALEAAGHLQFGKVLLLSHTHAACGEFQRKCARQSNKVDVETCDSFCLKLISSYARPLKLPSPVEAHLGRVDGGIQFGDLSKKACELLRRAPTVAKAVGSHYPLIILDEHQDAQVSQHDAVMLLRQIGHSKLRIFGDPMQAIHMGNTENYIDWGALWKAADERAHLEKAHRWSDEPELGDWIMACRSALKAGNPISLRDAPQTVSVSTYANLAGREKFRDPTTAGREIRGFLKNAPNGAAILAFLGGMAKTIAQTGSWAAPMNEGAQLKELDALIEAIEAYSGDAEALSKAFLLFLGAVGAGLTKSISSGLRSRLGKNIERRRAGSNQVAWLDCLEPIYISPDHRGLAAAMRAVRDSKPRGYKIRFHDHVWALCSFDRTDDPRSWLSMLGRIRRQRKWPPQTVSTIHKAKGLDFDHVLLCPVDRHQYPDSVLGRRLLYVALSRARRSIKLVVASDGPSSHVIVK